MATNVNEMALAGMLRRRDRRIIGDTERRKTRISDATKAGSVLEADMLAARMGQAGEPLRGGFEGALTAGTAAGLERRAAAIDRDAVSQLQGPGRTAIIEGWQRAQRLPIEEKVRKQQEGGAALATGSQMVGAALQAAGTIAGGTAAVPLQVAGTLTSALGSGAGAAISGTAMSDAERAALRRIGTAGSKAAADVPSYASMLTPADYKGFELKPGGGFNPKRRKQFGLLEEEDLFEV